MDSHVLAPPFGLPPGDDERLLRYLRDDAWNEAVILLRRVVKPDTKDFKQLLLLAHVRFHDALEVMVDELAEACREALSLIDRAVENGAPFEAVAPLRSAVERALDEVSREELKVMSALEKSTPEAVPLEVLEHAAFLEWRDHPAKAAVLFDALALRIEGPGVLGAKVRAALARIESGDLSARGTLYALAKGDWAQHTQDAALLEAAWCAVLRHTEPVAFDVTWHEAESACTALGWSFPSVWPDQDLLLARCLEVGDRVRARALAQAVAERDELPNSLQALVDRALDDRPRA